MRAERSILNLMFGSLDFLHAGRAKALRFGVDALLKGRRLVLTSMGRAARGRSRAKHSVKRIDRLVGNHVIAEQTPSIFGRLVSFVIGTRPRPIVLVDWTALGRGSLFHALVASVPTEGRALIIFSEVHPLRLLNNAKVEKRFILKLINEVLPKGCAPIIVTDAGFRTPWFDVLRQNRVDFVGRLRHRSLVKLDGEWAPAKKLHERATRTPVDLGIVTLTRSRPRPTRLVLVRKPRRHRVRRTARGQRGNGVADWRGQASAREPWLLVTSLGVQPERVVALYAERMQIEETFRDLKSHRFGWSLEDARCTTAARWQMLLTIAALAAVVIMLIGMAAEAVGFAQQLVANTSQRRVFSVFTLGLEALNCNAVPELHWRISLQMLAAGAE